ncbi:hypothetical protein ALC57_12183, partial [Trachymyrmex cornetzi]
LHNSDEILPRVYALPKIHKPNCPFRIVVSSIGSPLHTLTSFLHNIFCKERPKCHITKEQLEFLIQENYTAKEMTKHFDCSTKLVYKKCYSFGIKMRNKYYNDSDAELYREIFDLHAQYSNSGIFYYILVLHNTGCIDGYSRLIIYLKCTTSMTTSTVIPFFATADFRHENLFAMVMNAIRGLNRGSHLTGRSVHNQCIERLWVDVFKEVIDFFHNEKFHGQRQLWLSGMLNNANSEYTAVHEIFQDQPHLYDKIIDAFGIDDLDIAIITRDEESNSNLTVQLELSEDQMNYITNVLLNTSTDYKLKYLQIVTYFNTIN